MAMLKTQLPKQTIIWVDKCNEPTYTQYRRSPNGGITTGIPFPTWYCLRIVLPFARTSGAKMKDRPPVELLATMGIKVLDAGPMASNYHRPRSYLRWTVIGCVLQEFPEDQFIANNIHIDPLVEEFLRTSKKVTNDSVQSVMSELDEGHLDAIDMTLEEETLEEGWAIL